MTISKESWFAANEKLATENRISEILWIAANEKLWSGNDADSFGDVYSCDAVGRYGSNKTFYQENAIDFLIELGVNYEDEDDEQFIEFEGDEERQGARYLWLDFARLVAEDEGL